MILLAILFLLAAPLVMFILRLAQRITPPELQASLVSRAIRIRSGFAYYRLVALVGTLAAWLLVLLSRPRLPYAVPLANWRPVTYFPDSPKLLVDPISWSFALALATLALVVILTVPMRQQGNNWHAWASSLALAGFGLLAVLAGNPLTLMLAWAALDILEIFILLVQVRESKVHVQSLASFAARVGGLGLLLWADISAGPSGNLLSFSSETSATALPTRLSLFLLIAAGLRLGVLPLHLPYLQEPPLRRGLGTSLRLVPAAASLVLLTRTAYAGVPASWAPYLLALVGLSALYGAIQWVSAPDELNGRPYWVLGMTSFAVASAVCGVPAACLAWGLACIFSGGLLFLFSARHRNLLPLPLFGLFGFLGLPFTPAWGGMQLYASRSLVYFLPVFVLAHALLVFGYILHSLRVEPMPERSQRWVWVLYPIGLVLFPLVQFAWLWQIMHWSGDLRLHGLSLDYTRLPLLTWLGGVMALGLAVLLWWMRYRIRLHLPRRLVSFGQKLFSLRWFYNLLAIFLRLGVRLVKLLTGVLEGEGGILWVLVLLALLVVLLLRGGQL